jgi:hypothetical protein
LADHGRDFFEHPKRRGGLRENLEFVPGVASRLNQVVRIGVAGEEQDAAAGRRLADQLGQRHAIHSGQDNVRYKEGRLMCGDERDGVLAAIHHGDVVAGSSKDDRQGIGEDWFIVDDEDAMRNVWPPGLYCERVSVYRRK